MTKRGYLPFARPAKPNKWQQNHVFIISRPDSFSKAQCLYMAGQCQPAIPIPENVTPPLQMACEGYGFGGYQS